MTTQQECQMLSSEVLETIEARGMRVEGDRVLYTNAYGFTADRLAIYFQSPSDVDLFQSSFMDCQDIHNDELFSLFQ